MSDFNLLWTIWICCERFEFDVSDLNLMWAIFNLLWAIWICCERFEFDVSDLNLMWAIFNLLWAFGFDVTVVGHRRKQLPTVIADLLIKDSIKWHIFPRINSFCSWPERNHFEWTNLIHLPYKPLSIALCPSHFWVGWRNAATMTFSAMIRES